MGEGCRGGVGGMRCDGKWGRVTVMVGVDGGWSW